MAVPAGAGDGAGGGGAARAGGRGARGGGRRVQRLPAARRPRGDAARRAPRAARAAVRGQGQGRHDYSASDCSLYTDVVKRTTWCPPGDRGRGPRGGGAADLHRKPGGRRQVRFRRHQDHAAAAPLQDERRLTRSRRRLAPSGRRLIRSGRRRVGSGRHPALPTVERSPARRRGTRTSVRILYLVHRLLPLWKDYGTTISRLQFAKTEIAKVHALIFLFILTLLT